MKTSCVEYSMSHPEVLELLRQKVRILYPKPTVWSSHPLHGLTTHGGERLLHALQDADIQRLAWERHGFRSGLLGTQNDPKVLQVVSLPGGDRCRHVHAPCRGHAASSGSPGSRSAIREAGRNSERRGAFVRGLEDFHHFFM